jgi:RNA polymerase sigma factor (sigma-70 family)
MVDDWPMSEYSDLLLRQLPLIERITTVICRRYNMDQAAIEEFMAEVRLRFVMDDYEALRAFRGRSSFSTYAATVIGRMLINQRRHQLGKWHDSAEARRRGPIGIDVERALVRDGRSIQEALPGLVAKYPGITAAEIEQIAATLPGRVRRRRVNLEEAEGVAGPAEVDGVIRMEMAAQITAVVCSFIDGLPGDDQLILRLRFDCDMTVAQIARSLHRDQQVLYRLLHKHFDALRTELTRLGIDAKAVEDLIGSDSTLLDFRLKNRSVRPSEAIESEVVDGQEDTSS